MSNATATKPTAKPTGAPVVVPDGVSAKSAAAATVAAERLSDAIAAAVAAGNGVYVARYGADIDPAAVKLARAAAVELSGGTKSRGGARANVLAVLDALSGVDSLTDAAFVAAARTRLDELAAAKRERTERKKELAATVNDHGAPVAARTAALEVLAGMDEADAAAKRADVERRLHAAIMAARVAGVSEGDALAAVAAAYAVTLGE